jgi:hypothetical protein
MGEPLAQSMRVKLVAKTKKGKQRIKQHGAWWVVVSLGTPACCNDEPAVMVKPLDVHSTSDLRWIQTFDDPDFEIVEQTGVLTIEL